MNIFVFNNEFLSCVLNLFKHFQINSSNLVECEDSLTGPTGVKAKVRLVSNDNFRM